MKTGKKLSKEDFKNLPWWAWVYIVACIALPITTLGGAIPALAAFSGIVACVRISALPNMRVPIKALCSLGVVIGIWVITYLFVFAVASII